MRIIVFLDRSEECPIYKARRRHADVEGHDLTHSHSIKSHYWLSHLVPASKFVRRSSYPFSKCVVTVTVTLTFVLSSPLIVHLFLCIFFVPIAPKDGKPAFRVGSSLAEAERSPRRSNIPTGFAFEFDVLSSESFEKTMSICVSASLPIVLVMVEPDRMVSLMRMVLMLLTVWEEEMKAVDKRTASHCCCFSLRHSVILE
jgi:hypothetical protein